MDIVSNSSRQNTGYCIQLWVTGDTLRARRKAVKGIPSRRPATASPAPGRHRQGSWSARTIRSPYTAATWLPAFAWNFTVTAGFPATSDAGTAYVTS